MGDIEDSLGGIFEVIAASILSRGVGANVDVLAPKGNLSAVGFVDGAVDFFEVVGVGKDLVAGDDVLECRALGIVD